MNEQPDKRHQQLAYEKTLFAYGTALADGEFATVSQILAQAESDPVLTQMIVDLNAAHQAKMEEETMMQAEVITEKGSGPVRFLPKISWRRYAWLVGGILAGMAFVFCSVSIWGYGSSFSQPQLQVVEVTRVVTDPSTEKVVANFAADYNTGPFWRVPDFSLRGQGVSDGTADTEPSQPEGATGSGATGSGQTAPAAQPVERLIIRNGSLSVVVADPLAVRAQIEARVAEMAGEGAFVVSSEESGRNNALPTINMTIRVPAARFEETMRWLAGTAVAGTNPNRSETAQDVTEEYVDLAARQESLEAARDRLLDIMQNAETTEDLLRAEAQLAAREAEIEALQGRRQYLQQSAALSLITIQLKPYVLNQPFDDSWKPAETVRLAVEGLVASAQGVADFLIILVIAFLPWLAVLSLAGYIIVRFIWRPWRVRRQRG